MEGRSHDRLLSIGEFAAATQLTPKALRLYDDQGLLRPATTDASNGYRYYRVDQVSSGRLIRSLRDMALSLTQISQVLDAERGQRELLLREFLHEAERRLARERTAYRTALLMINRRVAVRSDTIDEVVVPAQLVSVWEFSSDRRSFKRRYLDQRAAVSQALNATGIDVTAGASCVLLEPLTDDEARLELRVPIAIPENERPADVTLRHLPARRCAIVSASASSSTDGFTSPIDAIFDWFDRRGAHALGQPEVLLDERDGASSASVRWAFATGET